MSIEEKLVAIAENEPKVYKAGYDEGVKNGGGALPFEETSQFIRCFPHTDYPFTVVANADCEVKQCGNNLFNINAIDSNRIKYDEATGLWNLPASTAGGATAYWYGLLGDSSGNTGNTNATYVPKLMRVPANTTITFSIKDLKYINPTDGSEFVTTNSGASLFNVSIYDATGAYVKNNAMLKSYVDDNGFGIMSFTTPNIEPCYLDVKKYYREYNTYFSSIQVEIGGNSQHKPYTAETYTLTANEPMEITPLNESNYLFADNGEITVSGKLNAQIMYEALTLN